MPRNPISFSAAVSFYDDTRKLPSHILEQAYDLLYRRLGWNKGDFCAEVGVGTGNVALQLAMRGLRVLGLDVSREMMALAPPKFRQAGVLDRLLLLEGDARQLPIRPSSFTCVVFAHILHLLEDWKDVLRQCRALLKPGGHFVISGSSHRFEMRELRLEYRRLAAEAGYPEIRPGIKDIEEAAEFLEREGCRVEWLTSESLKWSEETALTDLLSNYRRKLFSETWLLPEELHHQICDELERFAAERFGPSETVIPVPKEIRFILAEAAL